MQNRTRKIEALRRLAERPGTPAEGETARRLLEKLEGSAPAQPKPRPFNLSDFPRGARVWYCYWCYDNEPGYIACNGPEVRDNSIWMRIKFDRLKNPRWVPVTSKKGCHLSTEPFEGKEAKALYHLDWDWEQRLSEILNGT